MKNLKLVSNFFLITGFLIWFLMIYFLMIENIKPMLMLVFAGLVYFVCTWSITGEINEYHENDHPGEK